MRYLKYASWIFLALLDPIAATLAVILAPFVVPFYGEKKGHLPFGFRWMETYDNPIDGDEGHVKRWAKIRKISSWVSTCRESDGSGETKLITSLTMYWEEM